MSVYALGIVYCLKMRMYLTTKHSAYHFAVRSIRFVKKGATNTKNCTTIKIQL